MHYVASGFYWVSETLSSWGGNASPLHEEAMPSMRETLTRDNALSNMPWNLESASWQAMFAMPDSPYTVLEPTNALVKRQAVAFYRQWIVGVLWPWGRDVASSFVAIFHSVLAIFPGYTRHWAHNWQEGLWNQDLTWRGGALHALKRIVLWPVGILWAVLAFLAQLMRPLLALCTNFVGWMKHLGKGALSLLQVLGGVLAYPFVLLAYGFRTRPLTTACILFVIFILLRPLIHIAFDALLAVGSIGTVFFTISPMGIVALLLILATCYLAYVVYSHPMNGEGKTVGQTMLDAWLGEGDASLWQHIVHVVSAVVWGVVSFAIARALVHIVVSASFSSMVLSFFPVLVIGLASLLWVFATAALWQGLKRTWQAIRGRVARSIHSGVLDGDPNAAPSNSMEASGAPRQGGGAQHRLAAAAAASDSDSNDNDAPTLGGTIGGGSGPDSE